MSDQQHTPGIDSISRRRVLKTSAAAAAGGPAAVLGTGVAAAAPEPCSLDDSGGQCGNTDEIIYKYATDCWTDCGSNNDGYPNNATMSDTKYGIAYLGKDSGSSDVYYFAFTGVTYYYRYASQDEFCNTDRRSKAALRAREPIDNVTINVELLGGSEPATQVDVYKNYMNGGVLFASEFLDKARNNWGDTSNQTICDLKEKDKWKDNYDDFDVPWWASGAALVGGALVGLPGFLGMPILGTAIGGIPFVTEVLLTGNGEELNELEDTSYQAKYQYDWNGGATFFNFAVPIAVTVDGDEGGSLTLNAEATTGGTPCDEIDTRGSASSAVPTRDRGLSSDDMSIDTTTDYDRC